MNILAIAAGTALVFATDLIGWRVIGRFVYRIGEQRIVGRAYSAAIALAIGVVFAAIPIGILGWLGVPLALASLLLGLEVGIGISLRSIWATGLWTNAGRTSFEGMRPDLREKLIRRPWVSKLFTSDDRKKR